MSELELVAWAEEHFGGEDLFMAEPPRHNGKWVRHTMVAQESQAIEGLRVPDAGAPSLDELLQLRATGPR